MENRANIASDYFKLRLMLNKTNLRTNEKTEIEFVILGGGKLAFVLVATLVGINKPKSLELCKVNQIGFWKSSGFAGLPDLEDFCANFLNKNMLSQSTLQELKEVSLALRDQLQNLGISR